MFPNAEKRRLTTALLLLISFICFSFNLYLSLPAKVSSANAEAEKGKMLYQKYNCTACHQVYGLGGYLGPDLTNVYSTKGPEYIGAFLKSGTRVMPDFGLTKSEIAAITAYLQNVDASGNADPRSFIINYDGTIKQ